MPKEQLSLNKFEGGMVTSVDPRDIQANGMSFLDHATINVSGSIKLMARYRDIIGANVSDIEVKSARGYGIFSIKTDYSINEEGDITGYDDITLSDGVVYLQVNSSNDGAVTHNVNQGDKVRIAGITAAIDGYYTVKERTSSSKFVINLISSSITAETNATGRYFKIAKYSEYNNPHLIFGNATKVGIFADNGFMKDVIEIFRSVDREQDGTASTHTDYVALSYYYVDGGLRVCDSNFSNTDNAVNKIYTYLDDKTYFDFQQTSTLGAPEGVWTVSSIGSPDNFSSPDSTTFVITEDSNDADMRIESSALAFGDGTDYAVSFNLEMVNTGNGNNYTGANSYDLSDPDAVGAWPVVYYRTVSNGDTPSSSETKLKLAKPGHNHLTLINKGTGISTTSSKIVFYTNHKTAYTITDFKAIGMVQPTGASYTNISGRERGWYDLPQEIKAPSYYKTDGDEGNLIENDNAIMVETAENINSHSTTSSSDIREDCLIFTINKNEDISNSDWLFGSTDEPGIHQNLSFGFSWVYEGDQESLLYNRTASWQFDKMNVIRNYTSYDTGQDNNGNVARKGFVDFVSTIDGRGLDVQIGFRKGTPSNIRRIGARLYLTGYGSSTSISSGSPAGTVTTAPLLDDPLLFADIDFEKGVTLFDGTFNNWIGAHPSSYASFTGISEFPALTYKLQNLYAHDNESIYARYKTATIANNRVYIGAVRQVVNNSGELENLTDTVIKSPVGKFDVFPSNAEVVVVAKDGESIVALHNFNDRLLQFKQSILYIINIAGEYEFTESKLKGMGVSHPAHVMETDYGIAFFNPSGCFLFDGEKVASLTRDKIATGEWRALFNGEIGTIGYSAVDKHLICTYKNTAYVYNFDTQGWVITDTGMPNSMYSSNTIYLSQNNGSIFSVLQGNVTDTVASFAHTTAEVAGERAIGSVSFTSIDTSGLTGDVAKLQIATAAGDQDISYTYLHTNMDVPAITYSDAGSVNNWTEIFTPLSLYMDAITNYGNYNYNQGGEYVFFAVIGDLPTIFNTGVISFTIVAKSFGANLNADETGNDGFFGNPDAGIGAANATWNPPAGGVNPVQGISTLTITRDNTDPGDIYTITMRLSQLAIDQYPGTDIYYNDWTSYGLNTFTYESIVGDTATDIATALTAAINSELASKLEVTSSSGVITIKGGRIDESDTRPADKGYYLFQNDELTSTVTASNLTSVHEFAPTLHTVGSEETGFLIRTRDVDFGSPGLRKKVYKIYVTYRSTGNSNLSAVFYVNDAIPKSGNAKTFTAGASYNYTSSTLDDTGGEWKVAELIPSTSSDANNIYSIVLEIRNASGLAIPKDFEINDITFIYRKKTIK